MQIIYKENPLETIILLDENEKKELWYKIKIRQMQNILTSGYVHIKRNEISEAKKTLDTSYYISNEKSKLDEYVDQLYEYFLESLIEPHDGDCINLPTSCGKCIAENYLKINTLSGLSQLSAEWIDIQFKKNKSINEVIKTLNDHKIIDAVFWLNQYKKTYERS